MGVAALLGPLPVQLLAWKVCQLCPGRDAPISALPPCCVSQIILACVSRLSPDHVPSLFLPTLSAFSCFLVTAEDKEMRGSRREEMWRTKEPGVQVARALPLWIPESMAFFCEMCSVAHYACGSCVALSGWYDVSLWVSDGSAAGLAELLCDIAASTPILFGQASSGGLKLTLGPSCKYMP